MISKKRYFFLLSLIAIVYCFGLFAPIMELDSSQFAVMAMRMYQENDFVNLIKGTSEYLDKPHLHFWLSAISFKIFGLSNWAYRLPSFLLTILATYSCYGLGKVLYNKNIGLLASLMFLTAQTIVLANIDVRTDAVLTAFSIFSIWQLVLFIKKNKLVNIVLGAMAAALAFSTKGQIALLVIGLSLVSYLVYSRKLKVFWSWKTIVGLLVFAIFITPMLYAYYLQFDLHPEKIIRGKGNRTGLFFIFWEQSFDRLQGIGYENRGNSYFFFFHTILWEFIPWTFIMIAAFYSKIKEFIFVKFKMKPKLEFLTLGGVLLVLFIISFSKYKLPHYLNILIPLVAILSASYLYSLVENNKIKLLKLFLKLQYFTIGVLVFLSSFLLLYVFGLAKWYILVLSFSIIGLLIYFIFLKAQLLSKIITISVVASVFVNIIMNAHFYPELIKYQAGYQVALASSELKIKKENIYKLTPKHTWALDFYTQHPTPVVTTEMLKKKDVTKNLWVYVNEEGLKTLTKSGFKMGQQIKAPQFRGTKLSFNFLNPTTRKSTLTYNYLVNIKLN